MIERIDRSQIARTLIVKTVWERPRRKGMIDWRREREIMRASLTMRKWVLLIKKSSMGGRKKEIGRIWRKIKEKRRNLKENRKEIEKEIPIYLFFKVWWCRELIWWCIDTLMFFNLWWFFRWVNWWFDSRRGWFFSQNKN